MEVAAVEYWLLLGARQGELPGDYDVPVDCNADSGISGEEMSVLRSLLER